MKIRQLAAVVAVAALSLTLTPLTAVPAQAAASGTVALIPGLRTHVDQPCLGTGTDGARVQAMYLRETDQPDGYAAAASTIRDETKFMDDAVALSAKQTGGGRRIRWVTNSDCTTNVLNVVLPDGAVSGTFQNTVNALNAAGYLKANRKYVAFADVAAGGMTDGDSSGTCGYGTLYNDSKPTNNYNDGRYPQVARIDRDCWLTTDATAHSVALHELVHTLGGVQYDAPHANSDGHCTEEYDTMCAAGSSTATSPCARATEPLLDCNGDDYFNTNPDASNYLATHWNVAMSPFLENVAPLPDGPTLAVTPDNTSPLTGDVVTFTANVPAGTTVRWSTDVPSCDTTGASKTGLTYTIQCFNQAIPTVTAVATGSGVTTSTVGSTVTYAQGPQPTLVVSYPASAPAGSSFPLTASIANAKTTWTYAWTVRNAACTAPGGTTSSTLNATCSDTLVGSNATFTVAATRTADGRVESTTVAVRIEPASSPSVTVTGPSVVGPGQVATFTATGDNVASYQWDSLNGWGIGATNANTYQVQPPADLTSGSDTLYLDATFTDGSTQRFNVVYTVQDALAVTIFGPTALKGGQSGTFRAYPSKNAMVQWSVNQPACFLSVAADQLSATMTCPSTFGGTAVVSVYATDGIGSQASQSQSVSVTPVVVNPPPPPAPTPPPVVMVATKIANAKTKTGLKATMMTSAGARIPGVVITLQQRKVGTSRWVNVANYRTTSTGLVKVKKNPAKATGYRWYFAGDGVRYGSYSGNVRLR